MYYFYYIKYKIFLFRVLQVLKQLSKNISLTLSRSHMLRRLTGLSLKQLSKNISLTLSRSHILRRLTGPSLKMSC